MAGSRVRSEEEVQRLKDEQSSASWRLILWIYPRRPILTAAFLLAALVLAWINGADTARPVTDPSWRSLAIWVLLILGAGIRVWGSGNLRKNEEITQAGVYSLVRHPLYVGSLTVFLAWFVGVGNPWVGTVLFLAMVGTIYYPTMLAEEDHLRLKFPDQFSDYRPPLRLIPDPRRFPEALRTDRFSIRAAWRNLGLRSLWAIAVVPLVLEVVARIG